MEKSLEEILEADVKDAEEIIGIAQRIIDRAKAALAPPPPPTAKELLEKAAQIIDKANPYIDYSGWKEGYKRWQEGEGRK